MAARKACVMKHNKLRGKHYIEALGFAILICIFRIMPLDMASAFGGKLGQAIGPRLKWHKIALYNLTGALPNLNDSQKQQILQDMWNNLGRVAAEYAWLGSRKMSARIRLSPESKDILQQIKNNSAAVIFASGHFANWEIVPWVAGLNNLPITVIYRRLNNPIIDKFLLSIRKNYCPYLAPKGKYGAAALLRALKARQAVGLLVDQKMNEGIELQFMGKKAMTATALAELAIKFNAEIIMAKIQRCDGVDFYVQLYKLPYAITATANKEQQISAIMQMVNTELEQWIKENPAQWLWVHQRWDKLNK